MAGFLSTSLFALALLAASANAGSIEAFVSPGGITYTPITNEKLNWFDAFSFCEARGLELAHSIADDGEFNYLQGVIGSATIRGELVWIGGSEIGSEGSYIWVKTGAPVEYFAWDNSQAPDVNNRCMSTKNGLWWRGLCDSKASFICMTPPTPPTEGK